MSIVRRGGLLGWVRRTPYLDGLPGDVAVLSAVAFCVALGFGIAVPSLPVYAKTFGVSAFGAAAVISGFAFMRLVSAPGAGALVNRWGERRVLTAGIWIVALSSLVAATAQTYWQLLVMRGVGGIGSAMFTVSAMSLLLRTAGPANRGRASGAFQAGFLFGGISGPVLGGLVTGISIRAPFVLYGFTLVIAGTVGAKYLSRDGDAGRDATEVPAPIAPFAAPAETPSTPIAANIAEVPETLRDALRHGAYRAALVVNVANGFVNFGLRSSLIPLFVVEGLRRPVSIVGVGFLLTAAVQAIALVPAGRRTDSVGRRPSMIIGTASLAVSMALLAAGSGVPGFLIAMSIAGLATAFLASATAATVGDIAGGRPSGQVFSAYQMTSDVGAIAGPLAAGVVADMWSYQWAFGTGVGIAALGLVMAIAMPETLRHTHGTVTSGS